MRWLFGNASFYQLVFLVLSLFINWSFWCHICLSTGLLIKRYIWLSVFFNRSFCQLVFFSTSLLVNRSFVNWSSWCHIFPPTSLLVTGLLGATFFTQPLFLSTCLFVNWYFWSQSFFLVDKKASWQKDLLIHSLTHTHTHTHRHTHIPVSVCVYICIDKSLCSGSFTHWVTQAKGETSAYTVASIDRYWNPIKI